MLQKSFSGGDDFLTFLFIYILFLKKIKIYNTQNNFVCFF